jgi:hypothetical protein
MKNTARKALKRDKRRRRGRILGVIQGYSAGYVLKMFGY